MEETDLEPKERKFRNKQIFPYIKEHGLPFKGKDVLFNTEKAITLLEIFSRQFSKDEYYTAEELPSPVEVGSNWSPSSKDRILIVPTLGL